MKKILQISTLLLISFFYGQKVSDYQYIYIPDKFDDHGANKYGLNELLQLKLKQKKFTVINESKEKWPAELLQNSCLVLTADLLNTSNMFKNKIKVDFIDCGNKIIGSMEGMSLIKDYEEGMRDALEIAAKKIPMSVPVEKSMYLLKEAKTETSLPIKDHASGKSEVQKNQAVISVKTENAANQKADVYTNSSVTLSRIYLADGAFILVNPTNSVPSATFKPSTKKDVYRVQLNDGTSTLGYLEDATIIIELPNADGSFRREIFEKK